MEAALGAASGLIGSVVKQLSDEFVEAYVASTHLGIKSDEIKRDLMFTQGLLHEAQRRGVSENPGLQGLVQQLSAKADEAEDALDELHYFIIQDQLDGTQYAVPDLGDGPRGHCRHVRHALRHTVGLPAQLLCQITNRKLQYFVSATNYTSGTSNKSIEAILADTIMHD